MKHPDTQLTIPATIVGDDGIELIANAHPRGPVVALVDASASISPWLPELQNALDSMLRALLIEDELASVRADISIISFGGEVKTLLEFGTAKPGEMPAIPKLAAAGETPLGAATRHATLMIRDRLSAYRRLAIAKAFAPQVLVLSDGHPTDEWQSAADELRLQVDQSGWIVHPFGIGPNADLHALGRFSNKAAVRIDPAHFRALFAWFSRSVSLTSRSQRRGCALPQVLPALPPL